LVVDHRPGITINLTPLQNKIHKIENSKIAITKSRNLTLADSIGFGFPATSVAAATTSTKEDYELSGHLKFSS